MTLKIFFNSIILSLIISPIISQVTFFNNGQVIKVTNGGNIFVNGNMVDNGITANIINDGIIETRNSTYNGDFTIENTAVVEGEGIFKVEGNWINDATFITDFISNTSRVILTGNNQFITGTNVTTFYDLEMGNSSTLKTMTLNAIVTDSLILNNNELATQTNTLYFKNTDPGAITNSTIYNNEGYVSSVFNGSLARAVNSTSDYKYPVGSSLVTERYRPVNIKPTSSATDTVFVSMLNYNALNDGYYTDSLDTNMCLVNKEFYHTIERSGTINADISIFYDPIVDAYPYEKIGHWNQPLVNYWNAILSSSAGAIIGNYIPVTSLAWDNFAQKPYILGALGSEAPRVVTPEIFCKGQDSVLLIATGSEEPYHWVFSDGSEIISGQGNDSIYVNLGGTGSIQVYGDTLDACASKTTFYIPVYTNNIIAAFNTDTSVVYADQLVHFLDSSIGNINTWNWEFNNEFTSTEQNPSHVFSAPGTYNVFLQVQDSIGCLDTVSLNIQVLEYFFVPNVFSPNGDGVNDQFVIPFAIAGDGNYYLQIYNRWGTLVFETTNYKLSWDGYINNGELASEGTYYFVLTASSATKDYSTTGYLTLLR